MSNAVLDWRRACREPVTRVQIPAAALSQFSSTMMM